MKLVTFSVLATKEVRLGLWLEGEGVLDLAQADKLASGTAESDKVFSGMYAFIEGGAAALARAAVLASTASRDKVKAAMLAAGAVRLLAPIPRPTKNVFCVGRNYFAHIKEGSEAQGIELKVPKNVVFFTKPPTAVVGPDADVHYPVGVTEKFDYEVELGIIIGKRGKNISEADALDYIYGYTVINDITARDVQRYTEQWFRGKGLDDSCPMGPYIVTRDEAANAESTRITCKVNGGMRQDGNTSQMIFSLRRIISELSQGLTLEPGDIIATGTPSGVGYAMTPPGLLNIGDVVECEVEGIGRIVNKIVAP